MYLYNHSNRKRKEIKRERRDELKKLKQTRRPRSISARFIEDVFTSSPEKKLW